MRQQLPISRHRTVSNSSGFSDLGAPAVGDIECDVLLVARGEDGFEFTMSGAALAGTDPYEEGVSTYSPDEIFPLVEECRGEWDVHIVNVVRKVVAEIGGEVAVRPFQEGWDFGPSNDLLAAAGPKLATAGDKLFKLVFERKGDEALYRLAERLRTILQAGPRHMFISSDTLFLPWGMLYTHPVMGETLRFDGSNWKPEGFWGYRHIMQHMPRKHRLDERIQPAENGVPLSLNLNENITKDLGFQASCSQAIAKHIAFIANLGMPSIRRTLKSELRQAWEDDAERLERILYFFCHGLGASEAGHVNLVQARLALTDDSVTASDFRFWSGPRGLPTNPLFFINACQGGQMTTAFYKTFAVELLDQGAVGLIGAQVDLPAIFAAEYAQKVLGGLFGRGNQARLGRLLRDTNQELWDKHGNPLGLVYSLYRGANCFIDRPSA